MSDPQKKNQYDNFGTVGDAGGGHRSKNSWTSHDHSREFRGPGGYHSFMFEDMPFGSHFDDGDGGQKRNILNDYNYDNIVLPDSYHKPFLLFVVDDICFECEFLIRINLSQEKKVFSLYPSTVFFIE